MSHLRIKVLAPTVNYKSVLDYYNFNRATDEDPLEVLDRFEGGFQIQIPEWKDEEYPNNRIRQLRWNRGYLCSFPYIGFTEPQLLLLYEALVHSYGGEEGKVIMEAI